MTKHRLQATVDRIGQVLDVNGSHWWRVEVWEAFPSTIRRIYQIRATDDNMAAKEGLRRLTVELERPERTVH